MEEYGIFNDEGLIEGGFYEKRIAQSRIDKMEDGDMLYVARVCDCGSEEESGFCVKCN